MSEELKPALSAEEWKAALKDRAGMAAAINKAWGDDANRENDHALAALALIYQPFGFSQEDVLAIRRERIQTQALIQACGGPDRVHASVPEQLRRLESLESRISALLPPAQ